MTVTSGFVRRLAMRLGKDPVKLAESFDPDTVRRTKYPVIEVPQDDGSVLYKRPVVKQG